MKLLQTLLSGLQDQLLYVVLGRETFGTHEFRFAFSCLFLYCNTPKTCKIHAFQKKTQSHGLLCHEKCKMTDKYTRIQTVDF